MIRHISIFSVCLSVFLSFDTLIAQSVHVPLDHRVYDFLERMETRGLLSGLKDGSRPFTREHCARLVARLDSLCIQNPAQFTRIDTQILERLKGEFYDELQASGLSISPKEKEPHLYSRQFGENAIRADALLGGTMIRRGEGAESSEREINQPYYGAILRGNYRGIGFSSDNRIFAEWGSRKYFQHYDPSQGYPAGAEHDSSRATWDVSESYLTFQLAGIDFSWGRDKIQWGPAKTGLMLSNNASAFDLVSLQFPFGPAMFTWLHGELRSDYSHKWIAAHRLEVSFRNNLDIGFQEAVIYGKRGVESAYLIPILPCLTAQHTLGDRDNMTMGFDVDWRIVRNLKLYGDFFIDDLFAPWEIFGDFYGNKVAFTFGSTWVDPFRIRDSAFRVEYTRIEPYVYTHQDSVNTYEHYDQGLGHFLEPNSDRLWFETAHRFNLALDAALVFESIRHGEGSRRGSDRDRADDTKRFLSGPVEKTLRYGSLITGEPFRDLFIKGELYFVHEKNRGPVPRRDSDWLEGKVSIDWNW